jgi:DHA1 family tetracycline resistance protein-like MFS transporter
LTVFVDLLGFTLILPALPLYAAELGAGGTVVGVLLTSYSVMQFCCAPLLGRLSDRYGRRPVLLIALAGSTGSLALTGMAHSLWLLLFARAVAGACGGSIGVGQAFAVDLAGPAQRTKALGQVGAAVGLAFVAGPGLGAALAPFGFAASAFLGAALAGANLAVAAVMLPDPQRPADAATAMTAAPGAAATRLERRWVLDSWPAGAMVAAGFLTMFAFVGMEATFALLGQVRFGFAAGEVGAVLAAAGLAMVVVQLSLIGQLVAKWGDQLVCVAGAALMAGSLAVVPFLPQALCVAAVGLLAVGYGLVSPTLASMLAQAGPSEQRGRRLGAGQSLAAAGRAAGPVCAGSLFDVAAGLPYVVGAATAALVALGLCAVTSVRDRRERAEQLASIMSGPV